jgi:sugar lactone lactonase YvrE
MKIDGANRLWIAGGRSGRISVVDLASGKLVRQATVPTPSGSLINDVAIVGGAAYFTDTRAPMMWRMTAGAAIGPLEPWLSFTDTPVQYDGGNNLNGIVATPDGQSLVVVQMDKGLLFRIDIATKAVAPIATGNADLSGGDGLVLTGSTLYVVRQPAGEIVTLQLGPRNAQVVSRLRDPALLWPATAVIVDEELVVVNSQFNARATKSARMPFTLAAVPLVRLMPARPPR